jgi:hypothetical protein
MERERKAAQEAAVRRSRTWEPPVVVTGDKLEVIVYPHGPVISAAVLSPGHKPIAIRTWSLEEDGIVVTCECEKRNCPTNDTVLEPVDSANIEMQIEDQIEWFRQEYHVPSKRIALFAYAHDNLRPLPRLTLRGEWKNDEVLSDARAIFRQTYSRPRW